MKNLSTLFYLTVATTPYAIASPFAREKAERNMAVGDFDLLNEIFENASILLPGDYEVSERVGIATLNMNIRNITCYDLSVGDITVEDEKISTTTHNVDVALYKLDLTCEMNYEYRYGVLFGDGWVQIQTDGNSASSTIKFTSSDFDKASPIESAVEQCFSNVEIERMDFEGDLASEIVEIFQGLVRNVVENAIGDVACNELSQIGTALVRNMVELADTNLEPYIGDLSESFTDPLYPERNLDLPSGFVPVNLQDADGAVARAFNEILHFVDTSLGANVSDPDGVTATGNDLAINVMLRSLVLDENRALTMDTSELTMMDPILFEGHDRITQFTVTMNRIRVFGLDTFTRFNSFRNIGRHTIQYELTWASLTIELDVTVDISPSSLEDAILRDPTSTGITEQISIGLTVDQVDGEASLLLVLNEEVLGAMELGPLFYTENLLPCLLSVIHTVEIAGLDIDPKIVDEPSLSGFISPGLNRILTDAASAAFAMYSGVLRKAMPNIFQSRIRELINSSLLDSYESSNQNIACPDVDPVQGYIDFRKLFDPQQMIYGDVPPLLKEALDNQLLAANPSTGRPRINEIVVGPFTVAQSGEDGTLKFPFAVVDLTMSESISQFGLKSLDLKLFDPAIENMGTMGFPIKLLEPNSTSPHLLDNHAVLGIESKKLRFGLKAMFETEGDPLLAVSNELDIFVEVASAEVWSSFMAKLDSAALFNFQIQDITNMNCWLSVFATPQSLKEDKETGLSIQSLLLSAPSMSLNVSCSDCSSPSLMMLPEIMELFQTAGVSDVLEQRLTRLGLDLVQGDFTQSYINSFLMDSKLRCPHSTEYAGRNDSSTLPTLNLPALSYESVETIAFALSLVLEVAAVAAAEAHTPYNTNATTSLSAQANLATTDSVQLIDFTSMESSFGQWGLSGIDGVIEYLTEVVTDPSGPDGKDMRVNSLIRTSTLGNKGYASLTFADLQVGATGMEVYLKQMNIIGLDSITDLNIMNAVGPQTLKNEVTWKSLKIALVVSLMASESSDDAPTGRSRNVKQARQDVTINLELSNVHLSMSMFLALNQLLLGSLELRTMLNMNSVLPCLLSAAHGASLTEFQLSPESISVLSIDGFQSMDVQDAADMSTNLLLEKYGRKLTESIPKIFDSTLRTLVNNWMEYHMHNDDECNFLPTGSEYGFVDLRDLLMTVSAATELGGTGMNQYGDMFSTLIGFVRNLFKVDDMTGLSTLNDAVVGPVTEAQSDVPGMLYQTSDLFSGGTKVKVGALDAEVRFRAYDAKVQNLDTIGNPLDMFGGILGEAYKLNNTITFGVKEEPLRFSSKLLLDLYGAEDFQIHNEIAFSLDLFDANIVLSTMTKIAESRFFGFPLRDMFNMHCWLATIPAPILDSRGVRIDGTPITAALASLEAQVGQLAMTAQCTNCSSPRMSELTDLLSDPAAQIETTAVANDLLKYITQLMGGNFVQVQLDRLLDDAALKCPHSPDYDPDATMEYETFEAPETDYSTSYLILLGGLVLAGIIISSSVVCVVRFIVHRRHKKWVARLPPHQVKRMVLQQRQEDSEEKFLNENTASMFKSREIPCLVQWIIPAVILLNIGLFLSGHLNLGATVNIEAEVAGEIFTLEHILEFSIARSTIDIWNAGGRALAILILIFSGIWPYTKLLMTFVLWFTSPSSVSVNCRGSILLWLDWLAKWSMIDIFVLVISIAAFRISIESPDTSYLPDDFYSIEMVVIPLWGLYANMLAQLISQISSHVIIHYHRKICLHANKTDSVLHRAPQSSSSPPLANRGGVHLFRSDVDKGHNDADEPQENPTARSESISCNEMNQAMSLSKHQFSRPHRGETEKLVTRNYVNSLLLACAFCLVVLVFVGCIIPSFSLELFGLVGVAVEFGQDFQDATRYYSVFSVVRVLFEQASYLGTLKDYIGLGVISVLFLCTLLLVPLLQTGLLLRQWFAETTQGQKERMAVRLEILQAWQYLDVYLVSLFASSWQMGPVSDFMINSYCENLENMFAQMVYYGVLKEEDAKCFSVTSKIEDGAFFLASGAILLGFLSTFVFKAAVQYLKDDQNDLWNSKELERCNTSLDGTSHSDENGEEDVGVDSGFSGTIRTPPVLFTDSFRWMLKPDDSLPSSSRALFGDPNNTHWSLPEATAVIDESSHNDDNDNIIKGTYVTDLDEYHRKSSGRSPNTRDDSMESFSKGSSPSRWSSGKGRKLTYDESKNEIYSYSRRSLSHPQPNDQTLHTMDEDQQSIPSKMSSVGTSFKDEGSVISEAESLMYSLPSSSAYHSSQVPPPPPELVRKASLRSESSSQKKPPPPSFYKRTASLQHQPTTTTTTRSSSSLSSSSALDVSPFASYFEQQYDAEDDRKPMAKKEQHRNLKKKNTVSLIRASSPQPMADDSEEEFTQITMEDSEVTTDYFKKQPSFSHHSRRGLV